MLPSLFAFLNASMAERGDSLLLGGMKFSLNASLLSATSATCFNVRSCALLASEKIKNIDVTVKSNADENVCFIEA